MLAWLGCPRQTTAATAAAAAIPTSAVPCGSIVIIIIIRRTASRTIYPDVFAPELPSPPSPLAVRVSVVFMLVLRTLPIH